MVGLGAKRLANETWRDTVERISSEFGLSSECLSIYDKEIADGQDPMHAAWTALYEWDCLQPIDTRDLAGK